MEDEKENLESQKRWSKEGDRWKIDTESEKRWTQLESDWDDLEDRWSKLDSNQKTGDDWKRMYDQWHENDQQELRDVQHKWRKQGGRWVDMNHERELRREEESRWKKLGGTKTNDQPNNKKRRNRRKSKKLKQEQDTESIQGPFKTMEDRRTKIPPAPQFNEYQGIKNRPLKELLLEQRSNMNISYEDEKTITERIKDKVSNVVKSTAEEVKRIDRNEQINVKKKM